MASLALSSFGSSLAACGRGDTTVVVPPTEPPSAGRAPAAAGGASASTSSSGSLSTSASGGGSFGSGSGDGSGGRSGSFSDGGSGGARAAAGDGGAPPIALGGAAGASGESFRVAQPGRLVAIGDVHGDIDATRAALRLGGAIDDSDRWIGDDLTVVQTGDQLDRGDHEREIVDLFTRLGPAARAHGGRVVALNGNHEIMNVQGDFRYVTPGGLTGFAGVRPRSPLASGVPPAYADRAAAFLPGGAYALELAERDVIAVVGDSVFVHGGVLPAHVRYGIQRINREARQWMKDGGRAAPDAVAGESAPIWARDYSVDPVSDRACQALGEVLAALGARRMVVGHTVQGGGISSACDDRVYRIDVGLSRYYGQGPIQVLEIGTGGRVRILSAPR